VEEAAKAAAAAARLQAWFLSLQYKRKGKL
jgi:hypothetical protein